MRSNTFIALHSFFSARSLPFSLASIRVCRSASNNVGRVVCGQRCKAIPVDNHGGVTVFVMEAARRSSSGGNAHRGASICEQRLQYGARVAGATHTVL